MTIGQALDEFIAEGEFLEMDDARLFHVANLCLMCVRFYRNEMVDEISSRLLADLDELIAETEREMADAFPGKRWSVEDYGGQND